MKRTLFAALILCFLSPPSFAAVYGPYSLDKATAIDGDNVRGDIVLWRFPPTTINISVRVAGIDAPELRGNGQRVIPACEKVLARAAMAFVSQWLAANAPLTIKNVGQDKYGQRVEAVVIGGDGGLLSGALIAAGHARAYTSGQRLPWCQ